MRGKPELAAWLRTRIAASAPAAAARDRATKRAPGQPEINRRTGRRLTARLLLPISAPGHPSPPRGAYLEG